MINLASENNISVVIPLYNKYNYICEAIDSVLAQTILPLEIVVVDDGSTDGSASLVSQYQNPLVRLIRQENGGVSAARNRGLLEAKGNIIAFLDGDDRYLPEHLATIERLATEFPSAMMWATGYRRIWPDGRYEDNVSKRACASELIKDFYWRWAKSSFTYSSSIAINRVGLDRLNTWFPVGEKLGEDQDMWFRLAEIGSVAYFNRPLVEYRVEVPGSATGAPLKAELLPCFKRLDERLISGQVPVEMRVGAKRLLSSHYLNTVRLLLKLGQHAEALKMLRQPQASSNIFYWIRTWLVAMRLIPIETLLVLMRGKLSS